MWDFKRKLLTSFISALCWFTSNTHHDLRARVIRMNEMLLFSPLISPCVLQFFELFQLGNGNGLKLLRSSNYACAFYWSQSSENFTLHGPTNRQHSADELQVRRKQREKNSSKLFFPFVTTPTYLALIGEDLKTGTKWDVIFHMMCCWVEEIFTSQSPVANDGEKKRARVEGGKSIEPRSERRAILSNDNEL